MTRSRLRRVVLVGFMGAGKSTVGAALAAALGWRFVDADEAIEEEAGATVSEIFADSGEAEFRRLEERVVARLVAEEGVVVATGGGWAAAPGRIEALPEGTASFWLGVTPQTALARVAGGRRVRPLLDVEEPLHEVTALLEKRVHAYGSARWTVDTEGRTVEDVSARILDILIREHPELRVDDR